MAAGQRLHCTHCTKQLEVWDEGNPYMRNPLTRRKRYVHHPDPLRMLADGIDAPHICLDCGKEFMVDSQRPRRSCPKCRSRAICDTWQLEGEVCPICKQGTFSAAGSIIS